MKNKYKCLGTIIFEKVNLLELMNKSEKKSMRIMEKLREVFKYIFNSKLIPNKEILTESFFENNAFIKQYKLIKITFRKIMTKVI